MFIINIVRIPIQRPYSIFNKIDRFAWESGKYLPEHIIDKLSPAELNYFKAYLENIE